MFAQEKKALMEQVSQVAETLNAAHQDAANARQEAEAAEARCLEEGKKAQFFANQAVGAKQSEQKAAEGVVKQLQQKLKESQARVRELKVEVNEHIEDNDSKDYEIEMLREQKTALTKVKGSKSKQQEIVN